MTGKAAGIKGAVLSQRIDGVWQPLPGLSAKVKLLAPTSFRISAGKVAGPVLKVPVAPLVRLGAPPEACPEPSSRSRRARRSSSSSSRTRGWATVLEATSDEEGRFAAAVSEPGVYRARTAPGQGFAEGLSAQLEVP